MRRKIETPEDRRFSKDFFKAMFSGDQEKARGICKEINHRYYEKNKEKFSSLNMKWRERNPAKRLYSSCKSWAKKSGVEFNIEVSDLVIPEYCPFLGVKLDMRVGEGSLKHGPSIDRIDPLRGYTKGNVQIISLMANRMKNNANIEELIDFSKSVLMRYDPRSLNAQLLSAKSV